MKHRNFQQLLANAVLSHAGSSAHRDRARVQWDPERDAFLKKLEYRSIQIGIPAALGNIWTENWISGIEDVTEKARKLKQTIDEDPAISIERLNSLNLLPLEREYKLPSATIGCLGMNTDQNSRHR